jgi:diguanylate cyclase (GGDEF)-like protein
MSLVEESGKKGYRSIMDNTQKTSKSRILMVEDSKTQADVTREFLEKNGYEVIWAKDGASALRAVKTHSFDVVILDLILPDMNGSAICNWLKSNNDTKGIPLIMLTVKDSIEDRVAGIEAGADDYLPKPYNEIELNTKIYAALRTKALQDELRKKNEQLEKILSKVETLAITDPLTGLFNRRHLEAILEKEWLIAKRYDHTISCLMIDIDHFKSINDIYGHKTGDSVLREISLLLKKNLREVDTVARWGGEEFVAILPRADKDNSMRVASRITEKTSNHAFDEVPDRKITVTIGIACSGSSIDSSEKLINSADIALFEGKRKGRNRIEVAT